MFALTLVAKMPDNYAAMSHFEFFAEMYALYYDYDDPNRTTIPSKVAKWLDETSANATPKTPAAQQRGGSRGEGLEIDTCTRNLL